MADLSNIPTIPVSPTARGWTPEARARFLDHLADKGSVRAACACVGLSPQAAYCLRRRDALFARGWDAALVLAHGHSEQVLTVRALDGVEEPVYYRGEQVGVRRKYDTRLLLAHMARLDRMAESRAAQRDAGRFDELLALIAGARCPEELAGADGLPLARAQAIARAMEGAERRLFHGGDTPDEEPDDREADAAEIPLWQREDEAYFTVREEARLRAAAQWDGWFAQACMAVDALLAEGEMAVAASPSPRHCRVGGAGNDEGRDGKDAGERYSSNPATEPPGIPPFTPCTVSTVSPSALARVIAGPVKGFAVADHAAFHARRRR